MADNAPVYVKSPQTGNPGEMASNFTTMQTRISMLRAVYGGTETMRAQNQTFLPQYDKESDTRYQTRLNATFSLNKLREAVDAASAKPFRTLLRLENSDPDLDMWTKDIDMQGNHLHVFAHNVFNNAMLDGMCHILVDHPDTYNMPNLAAQQASGARPFFKMLKTSDVVAAYDEYAGGDIKTFHVRVKGTRTAREGFKEVLYNQLRVIEIEPGTTNGIVQLWEQKAAAGGGSWTFVNETPITNLAEVPFVTLYAGEKEADYLVRPVFIDLAYKQIEHWISSSDQRSILAAARFPMLACSGVQIDGEDEASFAIGPYKVLYAPEANGRWYYVEPKGTAIESGFKDLEHLEMQMDMMALNPVTGTHRQYVPQNERDIQETRVHSVVHDMAINCQDAIERAVQFAAAWSGKDYSKVNVLLNTEFSNTKDRLQEAATIIKMWESRGISREVMLTELKNRNFLGEDFDVAAEAALWQIVDQEAEAGEGMMPGRWTQADPAKDPNLTGAGKTGSAAPVNFPAGQNRPTKQI
jgi:hypothetical protein